MRIRYRPECAAVRELPVMEKRVDVVKQGCPSYNSRKLVSITSVSMRGRVPLCSGEHMKLVSLDIYFRKDARTQLISGTLHPVYGRDGFLDAVLRRWESITVRLPHGQNRGTRRSVIAVHRHDASSFPGRNESTASARVRMH